VAVAVAALIAAGVIAGLATGDVPAPAAVRGSSLSGVSCPSASWCASVGSSGSVYGVEIPFAVLSTSGSWAARSPEPITRSGNSSLGSVSCTSNRSCMAVGSQTIPTQYFGQHSSGNRPLAGRWAGTTWTVEPGVVPNRTTDAGLNGVSCAGTACMAVGSYQMKNGLEHALAEFWNGREWTMRLPPRIHHTEDMVLKDVACASANSCTAVGNFGYELAGLASGAAPLVERWDGRTWHPERSVNPPSSRDTEFVAVACPTSTRCVAVGFQQHPNGVFTTIAELRESGKWTLLPTKDPVGSPDTELADVACPLRDRCIAVGSTVVGTNIVPFAESWNGETWTTEKVVGPPGAASSALTAIDCVSVSRCVAVGSYRLRSPVGLAFSETWDGRTWSIVPVPGPTGTPSPASSLAPA
jgi:hypothetical protein